MQSQFVFLRIRPAGHRIRRDTDGTLPQRWLIAPWPDDYRELRTGNCLDHFEGRPWIG